MIGILTFHDTNNFGSLLQTYGLYKKIVDLGYACEIIDYYCPKVVNSEKPKFPIPGKNIFKYFRKLLHYKLFKKYREQKKFLKTHMKVSKRYYRRNIAETVNVYDKFIIGSDLVWEMELNGADYTYFLDFEKNIDKKNAFASSIGFPWKEEEKKTIKPLLSDFKHIAVREDASADWVEDLIGKRPQVVCDPTMLLTPKEWLSMVNISKEKNEGYVLTYFDTENGDCINHAIEYAQAHKLKVKQIGYFYRESTPDFELVQPTSIFEFLTLVYHADLVITASYHGILFSLYFNKPLIYYLRRQVSRVETLTNRLSISSCNGHDLNDKTKIPAMNYTVINEYMEKFRKVSIDYLSGILND